MTTNSFSRTREASKSYSRQADYHQLDQSTLAVGTVNAAQKIGSVNVDQLKVGFHDPNVQSAISDIANGYAVPVGGVVIRTPELGDPKGTPMTERLSIVGTATGTSVNVYGLDIAVAVDDDAGIVTNKVKARLNELAALNVAIGNVEAVTGSPSEADITFIDTNPHENFMWTGNGITITGSTSSPAVPGYGTWARVGVQEVTEGSIKTTLHYWKRVS